MSIKSWLDELESWLESWLERFEKLGSWLGSWFDSSPVYVVYEYGGVIALILLGLSVITLAIVLWKVWHLLRLKVWHSQRAEEGVRAWLDGESQSVLMDLDDGSICSRLVRSAVIAYEQSGQSLENGREATVGAANRLLRSARSGLKVLDLVVIVAPLLGLLGTVLGMIDAFQALQSAGTQTNPSVLAGGIWKALLTTAMGMGLAIPTAIILAWFESVLSSLQHRMEDLATQIFTHPRRVRVG